MKKLLHSPKSSASLMGIILISLFAYFGFSALFSAIEQDIKAEALIAAFGALFVLLPTKFLMEQENESRVKGDKRSAIFQANLADYQSSAEKMIEVLRDQKITNQELLELRQKHAYLILLGSDKAAEQSRNFLSRCQEIFENHLKKQKIPSEETEEMILEVNLEPEQSQELWTCTLEFLLEARKGLRLPDDDFTNDAATAERIAFLNIVRTQGEIETVIDKKYKQRQEVPGGLPAFCERRNISSSGQKRLQQFVDVITTVNPDIRPHYAPTQISFKLPNEMQKERVALYFNGVTKGGAISLSFPATRDDRFYKMYGNQLVKLKARNQWSEQKQRYSLRFSIDKEAEMQSVARSLNKLINKFQQEEF